jgi:serine/threonine-protein kinase
MPREMPTRIGKYEIRGTIGRGAMGEVFRGLDPVLGREVAIKIMTVGQADPELIQRFQREAQSAARLNHPNIITVYDFGDEDGKLYMAMELLEGHDVKDLMGKLSFEEKLGLMEQVAEGLAFAHSKSVVHRDLKPANIHVQPNGQVKILDFGLAKLGGADMTRTGTVMGTPFYMSPEQVRGEKVDARSDVFSIGSVFYEILTDHKPFVAESMHAVLFQVLQNQPEPVRKWAPSVPPILVEVVEKCLAKDASQRFADGRELNAALGAVHRALEEGRGDARLADELQDAGMATVVERPKVTRSGRGPGSSPPATVAGANALDPAAAGGAQTTVAGAAGTVRSGATRSVGPRTARSGLRAPAPPPSRLPLVVGGGAVALALLVGGYLVFKPGQPPVAPTPSPSGDSELTRSLVATQLALARRQLDDKDWKGAISQAEQILKLEPANAEAGRIRDAARQSEAEVEKTAREAREAFDAGRADEAAAALSRLLALDPNHAAAADLSGRLNSRFRGEAERARRQMQGAHSGAQRAGASGTSAYGDAQSLSREGESSFGKGAFASATRQFLASRDAYERARREALARATPPPTPSPSVAVVQTPPPTPPPTPVPTPTPAPPTAAPSTPTPTPAPVNEEPAIRRLVAELGQAIERKDLAAYKRLRPTLSSEDERKLRAAFGAGQTQEVSLSVTSIQISGNEARVRVSRRDTFQGRTMDLGQQTWVVVKSGGAWTVREIGQ